MQDPTDHLYQKSVEITTEHTGRTSFLHQNNNKDPEEEREQAGESENRAERSVTRLPYSQLKHKHSQ